MKSIREVGGPSKKALFAVVVRDKDPQLSPESTHGTRTTHTKASESSNSVSLALHCCVGRLCRNMMIP